MKAKSLKKLIVSLIADDLIHHKLINGLISLNLDAGQYYANIGDKVICLMGYTNPQQNQLAYERYLQLLKKGKRISLKENNNAMQKLAEEIYAELLQQKTVHP